VHRQTHDGVIGHARPVCVSVTDDVYVSDLPNDCVHVFDSSGAYVRSIGDVGVCGSGDGPCGVAVSRDGRLFVVDGDNHRVCVYE